MSDQVCDAYLHLLLPHLFEAGAGAPEHGAGAPGAEPHARKQEKANSEPRQRAKGKGKGKSLMALLKALPMQWQDAEELEASGELPQARIAWEACATQLSELLSHAHQKAAACLQQPLLPQQPQPQQPQPQQLTQVEWVRCNECEAFRMESDGAIDTGDQRFYCFGCWQAWEQKDADAGQSKADVGSMQAAPGAAEQAGQDQAEETQKRPQERTEVRKSRKAEEALRKKEAKKEAKKLKEEEERKTLKQEEEERKKERKEEERKKLKEEEERKKKEKPAKKEAKTEANKLKQTELHHVDVAAPSALAAAAASEANLEAMAKASLEAMGFDVTPQVRELMQSNKYQVDAVVIEILRLQEQEEQMKALSSLLPCKAPEPPPSGAATGASSHASASYFEHKLDAATARTGLLDELKAQGADERKGNSDDLAEHIREVCEEQLKLSTACAAHAVGSASESLPERPASPAEAAVTEREGKKRGREGGRGTANESAVLAPALQSAPRAQPQGVPTAVLARVQQETEALKQMEEPHVEVSSSPDTAHADQMEVLGARGPAHTRGPGHRSAELLVRSGGGGAAGGASAAGRASAAGAASSPEDVAREPQRMDAACGQAELFVAPAAPPLALDLGYGDEVDDECCMCMEAPPVATLIPCQHTCVCVPCAGAVMDSDKLCPLCRQPVATFEVNDRTAELAGFHSRCRKRLARTWWAPWKLEVATARAELLSSVDQGLASVDTAQKRLEPADFDGSLKALTSAVQLFDAARRWVPPLHAVTLTVTLTVTDVSSVPGDQFATWMRKKISNAENRCKLLKKSIESDTDRRNCARKELNAMENHVAGTRKTREKLRREIAQLDWQIELNLSALNSTDPKRYGAIAYLKNLQELEASAEKLSAHAKKIKDCKHFFSVGKAHMDEAAKQRQKGDFEGWRELRKAAGRAFAQSGISDFMASQLQAGNDFVGLVLVESDTLSLAAHDKLMKHVAKSRGGILLQSMAAVVGRRESFASILAKLCNGEEEESDGKESEPGGKKYKKKDFSQVDWKAKSKAKKEFFFKKIQNRSSEFKKEDTVIEQYSDLCTYLNLANLFVMDRSLQVSRAVALLYSCQLDECIFECEYLLACQVPASPEEGAQVFETLEDEELKWFDVALKVILAQALACYDDVPSLARADIIYNSLAVDNQLRKQCGTSFSAMQSLMEDFDAAKADCLRRLKAATDQFPTLYMQYVTASVVQKQQKSDFNKEAQELIHRLSQASNEYSKSTVVVQSHRQHYCKAHAEVQKLDAKQWNAVAGTWLRNASFALGATSWKSHHEVVAVFCLLLPGKHVEALAVRLLRLSTALVGAFTADVADRRVRDRLLQALRPEISMLPALIMKRLQDSILSEQPCVAILFVLLARGRSSPALMVMIQLLHSIRNHVRHLQGETCPSSTTSSTNQFREALRILKTQYDLFVQQPTDAQYHEQLELNLADALISATILTGVLNIEEVMAQPSNHSPEVVEVCEHMHQVRCAAVTIMMRRAQLRYKLVLAVNALMNSLQSESGSLLGLIGFWYEGTRVQKAIEEFEKIRDKDNLPRFREEFTFDDHLFISERNQTLSITDKQREHLLKFASQEAAHFEEITMPGWTASACVNQYPGEFVAGGLIPAKAAQALLMWMVSLAKVIPHAQACESAFKAKIDAQRKLEAGKTRMGYPVPPRYDNDQKSNDKKVKAFWKTFCSRNPDFARGGGRSTEDVLVYLNKFWPRTWDGTHEKWVFKNEADDCEKDWLPDELDVAGLKPFVEFFGEKDIHKYKGVFEDELKKKVESAIHNSADPATVHLLLSQPSFGTGLSEEGGQNSHHLASFASSSINSRDVECEACIGKCALHTCSGATIFSHLVRRVPELKKLCTDIEQKLDVIHRALALQRGSKASTFTAGYDALNQLLVAAMKVREDRAGIKQDKQNNLEGWRASTSFQQMESLVSSLAIFLSERGVSELEAAISDRLRLDAYKEAVCANPSQPKEVLFKVATLGRRWEKAGDEKPPKGRNLKHADLAKALGHKTEFADREWEAFGIKDLDKDDFILSDRSLGSRWMEVDSGSHKVKQAETAGTLLNNAEFSKALQKKAVQKKVEFSQQELDKFRLGELSHDSIIKVPGKPSKCYQPDPGQSYFKPVVFEVEKNALDDDAVRADLLRLASAMLASDLTRKHFEASRNLLHSLASLMPMLQAGCGHVATCSDLAILVLACAEGADVPPSILLNCFKNGTDQVWETAGFGLKFVGSWPHLPDVLSHLLLKYVGGESIVPVCSGLCSGGSCCKSNKYQQLMAWLLHGYCIPATHPAAVGPSDQEHLHKAVYQLQERRLTLMSLAFACNVFHCVDISGTRAGHSLTVCMVDARDKLVVWYDTEELPMRNYGRLLRVERGDSTFRLHLQSITPLHSASGSIVLHLCDCPGAETKALLLRRDCDLPWPLLPGLGNWEEGAEYEMVQASLKDFASAFEICLEASPVNLFSKTLAPTMGADFPIFLKTLLQTLIGFLLAKGDPYGETRSMRADLLHTLATCEAWELLQAFLDACRKLLGVPVLKQLLNAHDRNDQMTLLERVCARSEERNKENHASCAMISAVLGLGAEICTGAERRRAGFRDKHFSALHVASSNANLTALHALIKHCEASQDSQIWPRLINAQDARGCSPLYVTITSRGGGGGERDTWQTCADLLLERGAGVTDACNGGSDVKSPLELVLMFAEGGSWLASRRWDLLLKSGVSFEGLPVHALAERTSDDAEPMLDKLLAARADPNIVRKSLERETALHVAASHGHVRVLLGAPIKAKWQLTDARLNTPLHVFAERGNLEAVQLLVEDGAEFGRIALNKQNRSPMEVARGACKAFLEEELARRNKARQDRIVADAEKLADLERQGAARRLDSLRQLCAQLREPVTLSPRAQGAKGHKHAAHDDSKDAGDTSPVSSTAAPAQQLQKLDDEQQKLAAFMAEPKSSLLVIGRSGTGKTTVAIHRMVLAETRQNGSNVNQVFVTMNPVLLGLVKRNFRGFCPQRGARRTLPASLLAATKSDFPLFLDTRQWLSLLLKSVLAFLPPEHVAQAAAAAAFLASCGPVTEEHDNEGEGAQAPASGGGGGQEAEKGCMEVDVAVFTFRIWPLMLGHQHKGAGKGAGAKLGVKGQSVERSLSAEAVFAEIMSIIKGCTGAMRSCTGYLARQEYMALPAKAGAVAGNASIREDLYNLFLKYQEVKSELNCYDLCDVIFAAYSALSAWKTAGGAGGVGGELPIDSILVDEVQDCSQALVSTFLAACADPNSLFLAGDTCQTISKGVGGFRFEDLRSMFFQEQQQQLSDNNPRRLFAGDPRLINVPPLMQLGTNYRSHNGILRCANVLVSLLVELFPSSVDRMRLEESKTPGEAPILLPDVTPLELYMLIHRGAESSAPAEFGANQCIIVRNHETKAKVRIEFPSALVMTVEECKGLEFEDIIIFNFFSDSAADARFIWRAVVTWVQGLLLKLHDAKDGAFAEMRGVLGKLSDRGAEAELLACAAAHNFKDSWAFEASKHYIICEELKALYVSVTRAKKRVIVFDQDEARRAPMFELLQRAHVASKMSLLEREKLSSAESGSSLAQASTPEEWRAQGLQLFRAQRFDGAAQCFEKSKDLVLYVEAAACRDIADAMLKDAAPDVSAGRLAAAAERLLSIFSQHGAAVHAEVAAKCLVSAGVQVGHVSRTAGDDYLQFARQVLSKLGRSEDAQRCERMAESGDGGDQLVSACGIRFSQLLQFPWASLLEAAKRPSLSSC